MGRLLGVEAKTINEIPKKVWNMTDMEMKRGKLVKAKQIFKSFSLKSLTSSVHITQIFINIMMYKEQRFTSQSKKI